MLNLAYSLFLSRVFVTITISRHLNALVSALIAKLSISRFGSLSVLIMSTYEDQNLWIESFAKMNLRGVSTRLDVW